MKKIVSLSAAALAAIMLSAGAEAASPQVPSQPAGTSVSVPTADTMMVVSHGYAHLRKDPNTKSQILATLKKGTKVDVIEKVAGGKWAHVKADKLDGYIALSLLKAS